MSLKHSILATLEKKPRSGYEIAKNIESGIGFFWKASHQQIYKELSGLEVLGFVKFNEISQIDAPSKKVYRLTRQGRAELVRWIVEDNSSAIVRDPFLVKIFSGHLVAPQKMLRVISQYRAGRHESLKNYLEIERLHFKDVAQLSVEAQYQYLVLKRGIAQAKSFINWADDLESFVKTIPQRGLQ